MLRAQVLVNLLALLRARGRRHGEGGLAPDVRTLLALSSNLVDAVHREFQIGSYIVK